MKESNVHAKEKQSENVEEPPTKKNAESNTEKTALKKRKTSEKLHWKHVDAKIWQKKNVETKKDVTLEPSEDAEEPVWDLHVKPAQLKNVLLLETSPDVLEEEPEDAEKFTPEESLPSLKLKNLLQEKL